MNHLIWLLSWWINSPSGTRAPDAFYNLEYVRAGDITGQPSPLPPSLVVVEMEVTAEQLQAIRDHPDYGEIAILEIAQDGE